MAGGILSDGVVQIRGALRAPIGFKLIARYRSASGMACERTTLTPRTEPACDIII
jgi:hypothetical protein